MATRRRRGGGGGQRQKWQRGKVSIDASCLLCRCQDTERAGATDGANTSGSASATDATGEIPSDRSGDPRESHHATDSDPMIQPIYLNHASPSAVASRYMQPCMLVPAAFPCCFPSFIASRHIPARSRLLAPPSPRLQHSALALCRRPRGLLHLMCTPRLFRGFEQDAIRPPQGVTLTHRLCATWRQSKVSFVQGEERHRASTVTTQLPDTNRYASLSLSRCQCQCQVSASAACTSPYPMCSNRDKRHAPLD